MEKNLLFSQPRNDDEEEFLKLTLATPSPSSPSPPVFPTKPDPKKLRFRFPCDIPEDHKELVTLSLSTGPSPSPSPSPCTTTGSERSLILNSPNPNPEGQAVRTGYEHCQGRPKVRKNPFQKPKRGKSITIDAPYPWATTRRATVHSLDQLRSQGISIISGDVECKACEETFKVEYNLEEKFKEIKDYISANKSAMHDRAPHVWMNPRLKSCRRCRYPLKPVIAKKRKVNWLFLLLGQMLGCCKLSDLKYFCKHTKNHRTGAKDRVLYLTYLGLCKQLDPHGPFDV